MKVALIIYCIYESVFFKNAHSALDIQVFDSVAQCEQVKETVISIIKQNTSKLDSITATCKILK